MEVSDSWDGFQALILLDILKANTCSLYKDGQSPAVGVEVGF